MSSIKQIVEDIYDRLAAPVSETIHDYILRGKPNEALAVLLGAESHSLTPADARAAIAFLEDEYKKSSYDVTFVPIARDQVQTCDPPRSGSIGAWRLKRYLVRKGPHIFTSAAIRWRNGDIEIKCVEPNATFSLGEIDQIWDIVPAPKPGRAPRHAQRA